jgi:uncharacterized protein YqcC (DUF446 family)
MPDKARIKASIDEIEAEMKNAGVWSENPLPAEAYDFHEVFARDTMAYAQWLQFIFIPKVNEIIDDSNGQFPKRSQVGTQAIREFDGDDRAAELVSLLCQFDALIERG